MVLPLVVGLSIAQAQSQPADLGIFEVVTYSRFDHFTGKLGICMEEVLMLKKGKEVFTVKLQCYHSAKM